MSFFDRGELKLLWRLYFGNLITGAFFLFPAFMIVYFIGLGMSLTEVGFLLGGLSVAQILFEIPTGAIADKYGRKFSVLLGGLIESILFILLFFVTNYYALFILFFLLGAVGTLSSGAGESWIYDLILKKNKKILKNYYSKHQMFGALGLVISGFIGAFVVAKLGISWIWLISGFASLVYFAIIFPLEEVYTKKKEHKGGFKEILKQSKDSINYSIKNRTIFYIFLASFVVIIAVSFAEGVALVPYLLDLGFPEHFFGYFFSITSLTMALAPLAVKYIKTENKEAYLLTIMTLIGSAILALTFFVKSYVLAIGIIFISFLFFGMKYPVEKPFINKFIPANKRATILSFQSMICSLASIIALPLGGLLVDLFGARVVLLISSLLGVPTALLYLKIKKQKV